MELRHLIHRVEAARAKLFAAILLVFAVSLVEVIGSGSCQSTTGMSHLPRLQTKSSLETRASTRTLSKKISLSGGLLHTAGFYFGVSIGGQNLKLQLDTSYSSIIVPHKDCETCRVGDRRYNPAKSKTGKSIACSDPRCEKNACGKPNCFKCGPSKSCCSKNGDGCAFNVHYGDGSKGNGSLYYDVLDIQGLKANVFFGAMREETHKFELPYVDGVFGTAFERRACHPGCTPPAMDMFVNQTGIGNKFTMCVSRFGGTLVLGEADQSLASEPFKYVEVSGIAEKERYIIPSAASWKVGKRELHVPDVTQALLTTSTSSIGVSRSTFQTLLEHFMLHYCKVRGLCSTRSWFRPRRCIALHDDELALLPNITMGLAGGVQLELTPHDYLIPFRTVRGKLYRCLGFVVTDSMAARGIGLVLGATVMRRYAVVFDRENTRVGFAPAVASKCGPQTGTQRGFLGATGGGMFGKHKPMTAHSPPTNSTPGIAPSTESGQALIIAETCRAHRSCTSCASDNHCRFWYKEGRCVPKGPNQNVQYPYCSGMFCACFAVGQTGYYLGIALGVLLAIGLFSVAMAMYSKRQRNRYQELQGLEEQDLETF